MPACQSTHLPANPHLCCLLARLRFSRRAYVKEFLLKKLCVILAEQDCSFCKCFPVLSWLFCASGFHTDMHISKALGSSSSSAHPYALLRFTTFMTRQTGGKSMATVFQYQNRGPDSATRFSNQNLLPSSGTKFWCHTILSYFRFRIWYHILVFILAGRTESG